MYKKYNLKKETLYFTVIVLCLSVHQTQPTQLTTKDLLAPYCLPLLGFLLCSSSLLFIPLFIIQSFYSSFSSFTVFCLIHYNEFLVTLLFCPQPSIFCQDPTLFCHPIVHPSLPLFPFCPPSLYLAECKVAQVTCVHLSCMCEL